ncbi:FYVE zinc finger domain-containing protein [Ditylenchus destructor]|uniref:FYVE zinc finger domain-containing protein n=1 Tax=Ditylenchus destructor TaxID=166010 RepID=A0AAD4N4P6_9BILA|nr:FYVE zinc finger domain-containing protein [Ditylenchus destructor]
MKPPEDEKAQPVASGSASFEQIRAKFTGRVQEKKEEENGFKKTQKFFEQQNANIANKFGANAPAKPPLLPKPKLKDRPPSIHATSSNPLIRSIPPISNPNRITNGLPPSSSGTANHNNFSINDTTATQKVPERPKLFLPRSPVETESEGCSTTQSTSSMAVRSAIQRFNKIGPRLFEHPSPMGKDLKSPSPGTPTGHSIFYATPEYSSPVEPEESPPTANGNLPKRSDEAELENEESDTQTAEECTTGNESDSSEELDQMMPKPYTPYRQESATGNEGEGNLSMEADRSFDSRKSSFCKSDTLHTTILNEMRNKGLFKKISSTISGASNYIPEEVGRLRNPAGKTNRQPQLCISDPPSSTSLLSPPANRQQKAHSSEEQQMLATSKPTVLLRTPPHSNSPSRIHQRRNNNNTESLASSQSGSAYSDNVSGERDSSDSCCQYNTGDPKEDKRLRDLHGIAREFFTVQRTYVELLENIGEHYPIYLNEYANKSGRPLLTSTHVIYRISNHFKQILAFHKVLLAEFAEKYSKWDSNHPDLAQILQKNAEFLKICSSFLKEKRTLCAELQQALDESKELAYSTRRFEDDVLNAGISSGNNNLSIAKADSFVGSLNGGGSVMSLRGISIVMHLDAVHQNVVRYKLLMERYRKLLPDTLVEAKIADEALKKLTGVSNTVNGFLATADADKRLLELHRRLEGVFDVFAPGRFLIHEGELQRQTRKELQPRYLILFSDNMLICRYAMGTDHFDAQRIYTIPIDKVQVKVEEHEDHENEFVLISTKKSSGFFAKNKRERDVWVKRILEARKEAKDNRRKRRSYVLKQKPSTSNNNSCEDSPDVEVRPIVSFDANCNNTTNGSVMTRAVSENCTAPARVRVRASERYEAPWIPDDKATKCLMEGCNTKFNFVQRRHHCRQCGWLICRKCVGYAPVKVKDYERNKVCPSCYYDIKDSFEKGALFPRTMIRTLDDSTQAASAPLDPTADGPNPDQNHTTEENQTDRVFRIDDPTVRIAYDKSAKFEGSVQTKDLFSQPPNGALSKPQKDDYLILIKSRVYMRNRKGVEVVRWARLSSEMLLQFYEAEFDTEPIESRLIYGYDLREEERPDGGHLIELTHRNQFQTERKEDKLVFWMKHTVLAEKWISALRKGLGIEDPMQDEDEPPDE